MLMVVIGMEVFIVQPGFVQGLVEHGGFDDRQAGYIASAEMFGIAFTTVVMSFLTSRFSWRAMCVAGICIVITGNLLSIVLAGFEMFAATRVLVGIGSGALISLGYATVGLSPNPDRNFGYLIMAVLTYSALFLLAMPFVYATIGTTGILILFALLAACGLPFTRHLPVSGAEHAATGYKETKGISRIYKATALTAVFTYFLAQGVVWAYLYLIGTAGGGTEQEVAIGLTASQFLGIAGAFTAAVLGARFGRVLPLTLGTLGGVVPLAFLFGSMGAVVYGVAVCIYNFAANLMTPLLLAIIAGFDSSGRLVVYAVALQMLALATGPALSASVIAPGDYSNILWISMLLFLACLAMILPPVLAHARDDQK